MRGKILLLCFIITMVFINTVPASACWAEPLPFEILSEDGSKIFVFEPGEYGAGDAQAAVYEISNNERQLVYTIDGLASFAYPENFYYSSDMMHFARTFPESGLHAFEVFSYGVRTTVIMRNDFIEDYASIEAETSIGPSYTVNWKIEKRRDDIIEINTDEGNKLYFDLTNAVFIDDALPDTPSEQHSNAHSDIPTAQSSEPLTQAVYQQDTQQPESTIPPILICAVLALIAAGGIIAIRIYRRQL